MNVIGTIESATVLDRETRGESSLFLTLFAPDVGLVRCSKRVSAKKTSPMPDIFDDATFRTHSRSESALRFADDFEIERRRAEIAARYGNFVQASMIASVVIKNGAQIENTRRLSAILKKALDSLGEARCAEIISIKFLYLLARGEGYAVREDFFAKLNEQKKRLFASLIEMPSRQTEMLAPFAREMLEDFRIWTASNTDIILQ